MYNDEQEYSVSKVRTNRLYCSDCKRKLQKGETVVFDLIVDEYGHRTMSGVFGRCCSHQIMISIEYDNIFSDAIGHSQI